MKSNYSPLLAILLIGVVFMSGCVSQESPTKAPTTTQPSETPETTPPTAQPTTPSGTSQEQTTQQQLPEKTPSDIATEWVKALIKGSGSENVFNYLSQDVKSKYNSYDEWNDELYNMKYAWNTQGLFFTFIEVKNGILEGNNASVEVKYRASGTIQKTTTQKYEFIKEGNDWKLKEYYELTI